MPAPNVTVSADVMAEYPGLKIDQLSRATESAEPTIVDMIADKRVVEPGHGPVWRLPNIGLAAGAVQSINEGDNIPISEFDTNSLDISRGKIGGGARPTLESMYDSPTDLLAKAIKDLANQRDAEMDRRFCATFVNATAGRSDYALGDAFTVNRFNRAIRSYSDLVGKNAAGWQVFAALHPQQFDDFEDDLATTGNESRLNLAGGIEQLRAMFSFNPGTTYKGVYKNVHIFRMNRTNAVLNTGGAGEAIGGFGIIGDGSESVIQVTWAPTLVKVRDIDEDDTVRVTLRWWGGYGLGRTFLSQRIMSRPAE